jgi:uncharacterized protein YdhG (YjbR/CyaY superfamily)
MPNFYPTIESYLETFPESTQALLQQIREIVQEMAPDATEKISYGIPAFALNGTFIYYAAYKGYISLYPAPRGEPEFQAELEHYKGGKGTVQFPLDQPLPIDLITRIVQFQIAQDQARTNRRKR